MPRLEEGKPYKRFPRDLRDSFRFCRAMAERFKGVIQAWEPWNEANIPVLAGISSTRWLRCRKHRISVLRRVIRR